MGSCKNGAFNLLKDITWNKARGCIGKHLTLGGKEILIKVVATWFPVYSMIVLNHQGASAKISIQPSGSFGVVARMDRGKLGWFLGKR